MRLALVGTGYIGGSLARALVAAGEASRVVGYDADAASLAEARARGIVDETADSAAAAVAGADVVALACPVGATARILADIAGALAPGALVFDVGSTKAEVVAAAAATLRAPGRFVGAHPIAGREHRGPAHADAHLFRGRPCLLTPTAATDADALEACARLWRAAGAAVSTMDPLVHDRVVAVVSHLPHAAAFALGAAVDAALASDAVLADLAAGLWGGGFADTTRIAASNPAMWRDVLVANRAALLPLVDGLVDALAELRDAIERGDGEAIARLVERAGRGRGRVMGR